MTDVLKRGVCNLNVFFSVSGFCDVCAVGPWSVKFTNFLHHFETEEVVSVRLFVSVKISSGKTDFVPLV